MFCGCGNGNGDAIIGYKSTREKYSLFQTDKLQDDTNAVVDTKSKKKPIFIPIFFRQIDTETKLIESVDIIVSGMLSIAKNLQVELVTETATSRRDLCKLVVVSYTSMSGVSLPRVASILAKTINSHTFCWKVEDSSILIACIDAVSQIIKYVYKLEQGFIETEPLSGFENASLESSLALTDTVLLSTWQVLTNVGVKSETIDKISMQLDKLFSTIYSIGPLLEFHSTTAKLFTCQIVGRACFLIMRIGSLYKDQNVPRSFLKLVTMVQNLAPLVLLCKQILTGDTYRDIFMLYWTVSNSVQQGIFAAADGYAVRSKMLTDLFNKKSNYSQVNAGSADKGPVGAVCATSSTQNAAILSRLRHSIVSTMPSAQELFMEISKIKNLTTRRVSLSYEYDEERVYADEMEAISAGGLSNERSYYRLKFALIGLQHLLCLGSGDAVDQHVSFPNKLEWISSVAESFFVILPWPRVNKGYNDIYQHFEIGSPDDMLYKLTTLLIEIYFHITAGADMDAPVMTYDWIFWEMCKRLSNHVEAVRAHNQRSRNAMLLSSSSKGRGESFRSNIDSSDANELNGSQYIGSYVDSGGESSPNCSPGIYGRQPGRDPEDWNPAGANSARTFSGTSLLSARENDFGMSSARRNMNTHVISLLSARDNESNKSGGSDDGVKFHVATKDTPKTSFVGRPGLYRKHVSKSNMMSGAFSDFIPPSIPEGSSDKSIAMTDLVGRSSNFEMVRDSDVVGKDSTVPMVSSSLKDLKTVVPLSFRSFSGVPPDTDSTNGGKETAKGIQRAQSRTSKSISAHTETGVEKDKEAMERTSSGRSIVKQWSKSALAERDAVNSGRRSPSNKFEAYIHDHMAKRNSFQEAQKTPASKRNSVSHQDDDSNEGKTPHSAAKLTTFSVGDIVMGRCELSDGSKRWFPGSISAVNKDGTYAVKYKDGDSALNQPEDQIKAARDNANTVETLSSDGFVSPTTSGLRVDVMSSDKQDDHSLAFSPELLDRSDSASQGFKSINMNGVNDYDSDDSDGDNIFCIPSVFGEDRSAKKANNVMALPTLANIDWTKEASSSCLTPTQSLSTGMTFGQLSAKMDVDLVEDSAIDDEQPMAEEQREIENAKHPVARVVSNLNFDRAGLTFEERSSYGGGSPGRYSSRTPQVSFREARSPSRSQKSDDNISALSLRSPQLHFANLYPGRDSADGYPQLGVTAADESDGLSGEERFSPHRYKIIKPGFLRLNLNQQSNSFMVSLPQAISETYSILVMTLLRRCIIRDRFLDVACCTARVLTSSSAQYSQLSPHSGEESTVNSVRSFVNDSFNARRLKSVGASSYRSARSDSARGQAAPLKFINVVYNLREYFEVLPSDYNEFFLTQITSMLGPAYFRLLRLLASQYFTCCLALPSHLDDALKIGEGGFGNIFKIACPPDCAEIFAKHRRVGSSAIYKKETAYKAKPCHNCNCKYHRTATLFPSSKPGSKVVPVSDIETKSSNAPDEASFLRYYAVKRVPRERTLHDTLLLYGIFNEVSCLELLSGVEGVCQLFDYGVHGSEYWLVMELGAKNIREWRTARTEGSAVNDTSGRGDASVTPLSAADLGLYLAIFVDILLILQSVHDADVAHFDIKCDNFVFHSNIGGSVVGNVNLPGFPAMRLRQAQGRPSGCVMLIDFGEAVQHVSDADSKPSISAVASRCRGTLAIQSPEFLAITAPNPQTQAAVEKSAKDRKKSSRSDSIVSFSRPGKPSDVWSVGCLLAELLTGEFLFANRVWADMFVTLCRTLFNGTTIPLAGIEQALSTMPESVKHDIGKVVLCVLQQLPDARPPLSEIINMIDRILSHPYIQSAFTEYPAFPPLKKPSLAVTNVSDVSDSVTLSVLTDVKGMVVDIDDTALVLHDCVIFSTYCKRSSSSSMALRPSHTARTGLSSSAISAQRHSKITTMDPNVLGATEHGTALPLMGVAVGASLFETGSAALQRSDASSQLPQSDKMISNSLVNIGSLLASSDIFRLLNDTSARIADRWLKSGNVNNIVVVSSASEKSSLALTDAHLYRTDAIPSLLIIAADTSMDTLLASVMKNFQQAANCMMMGGKVSVSMFSNLTEDRLDAVPISNPLSLGDVDDSLGMDTHAPNNVGGPQYKLALSVAFALVEGLQCLLSNRRIVASRIASRSTAEVRSPVNKAAVQFPSSLQGQGDVLLPSTLSLSFLANDIEKKCCRKVVDMLLDGFGRTNPDIFANSS